MKVHHLIVALAAVMCAISSCEKHPEDHGDEHAVPGRFVVTLVGTSDTLRATWIDADGPGGAAPIIDTLRVPAGEYLCTLEIFSTSGDSLTSVIRAQGTEHQFFYSIDGAASSYVGIELIDRDARGMPLGLATRWHVAAVPAPAFGTLRIRLYHYEPNTKDGQSPSPETDADVRFPLVVVPN